MANQVINNQQLPLGPAVQMVSTLTSAVATGTTQIPLDDTIPQNTEGDQYMTVAITPKYSTSILVVQIVVFCSVTGTNANAIAALFQDSTANSLAVGMNYQGTATAPTPIVFQHTMTSGTTSTTTFKLRAGPGGAQTLTFNGQTGSRLFGTTPKSSMIVTEYKA
jgi:hypothetical protein